MNILGLISVPNWLLLTTVVLIAIYKYSTWHFDYWKNQNVKTGFYAPILGSFWTSLYSTFHDDDAKNYKTLGKIWGLYDLRNPSLIVADLEMIKLLTIKEFHNFPERRKFPLGGKSKIGRLFLSIMDGGEEWKFHRGVLSPTFTSGKLRQMGSFMEGCGDQMIKNVHNLIKANPDDMEMKDLFARYTMDVIATCCFGYKMNSEDANDPFIVNVKKFSNRNFFPVLILMVLFPKLLERLDISIFPSDAFEFFENAIRKVLDMRGKDNSNRNDFLQLLMDAQKENQQNGQSENKSKFSISDEAVVAHSMLFLIAGMDTSSSTICFAIYILALNPECQDRLIQEIDQVLEEHGKLSHEIVMGLPYLDMVVSETLRYFPLATRLERRCYKDCNLGGIQLKEGMMVGVPIWAIHHSEEYYPDPEKFDPERFSPENKANRNPFTYLPFGAGPRNCIGMRFALMQVKMGLAKFLSEFRATPSSKTQIPMKYKKAMPMLIPTDGFHLKIEKRRN